jgi:hypothetical protein
MDTQIKSLLAWVKEDPKTNHPQVIKMFANIVTRRDTPRDRYLDPSIFDDKITMSIRHFSNLKEGVSSEEELKLELKLAKALANESMLAMIDKGYFQYGIELLADDLTTGISVVNMLNQIYVLTQNTPSFDMESFASHIRFMYARVYEDIDNERCNMYISAVKEIVEILNKPNNIPSWETDVFIMSYMLTNGIYTRIVNHVAQLSTFDLSTELLKRKNIDFERLIEMIEWLGNRHPHPEINAMLPIRSANHFEELVNETRRLDVIRAEEAKAKAAQKEVTYSKPITYNEEFKEILKANGYHPPTTQMDMVNRGAEHHICVGDETQDYLRNAIHNNYLETMFMDHEKDKLHKDKVQRIIMTKKVTVELLITFTDKITHIKIVQAMYHFNEPVPKNSEEYKAIERITEALINKPKELVEVSI